MIQYLEAYCDINEIYEQDSLVVLWNALIKNPNTVLKTFSKYAFILHWFQELLQEKRDVEAFMTLGDISSSEKLQRDNVPYEWIEQVSVGLDLWIEYDNAFVVFDKSVEVINSKELLSEITRKIEDRGGRTFIIK